MLNQPSSAFDEPALINPAAGMAAGLDGDRLPNKGTPVLMRSLKDLHEAQDAVVKGQMFYDGDVGDLQASPRVQALLAQAGVNEIEDFNYAKVPVDSIAEKLEVRSVTASAGQDATDDDPDPTLEALAERAQETIDELRKRNQLDAEEGVLHLNVSIHGDAYMFVWPVSEEIDEAELAARRDTTPTDELDLRDPVTVDMSRVVAVDMFVETADQVRVFYDPENPLRKTHAVKNWEQEDDEQGQARQRATLYFADRIERWIAEPDEDPDDPETWRPYLGTEGDDEWPLPNPTGRVPFFHFRTKRPYGLPEHRSAYGPQRLINKLIAAHAGTIDYNSWPQRYFLINPKTDNILQNLADPDFPEDEDDDPEGDGRSQYRADPSAIWQIPGASGVGQFAAADPSVFLLPLDRYIKAMAELTHTPLDEFAGYSQPPSGESRKFGQKPLTDKARNRQSSYGAVHQDAYEFALELLGFEDITVDVEWAPVETASGLDDWNIVGAKAANGVPIAQVLVEAGYPRDKVEGWLNDETGADLTRRVALLNAIGTAIQTVGAGVGLGVVSAPQAAEIFARILGLSAEGVPELDTPVQIQPPPPPPVPGMGPPAAEGGDEEGGASAPPAMPPPPPPFNVGQGGPAPNREA